jgi:hypothetical protein
MATSDLYSTIQWYWQPQSLQTKEEALKTFLEMPPQQEMVNGIPMNTSKFLYLYGKQSTGKLFLLKKLAKEKFGQNWENTIYLRVDEGKKYPYKLHAHKVESSSKVILVTDSLEHYTKWKELYPATRAIEFLGEEHLVPEQGTCRVRISQFEEMRNDRNSHIRKELRDLFENTLRRMRYSGHDEDYRTLHDVTGLLSQVENLIEGYICKEKNDFEQCVLERLD